MWLSCLVVFISSACALVIELIAGRMMAPYIGVSLYTWTSIIGVVLAGMSAGNFLGGVVADRFASRRVLGLIFIAGSVSSLGILVVTHWLIAANIPLSLLPRIVFYTTAAFFLPSLVLGMVSPVVVKLTLADLGRAGNTVGTIYAVSTIGSIFGTFLTGFWLISWLGTRSIVWTVAGVLLLMGIVIGRFYRSATDRVVLAGAGIAGGGRALAGAGRPVGAAAARRGRAAHGALVAGRPGTAARARGRPAVSPGRGRCGRTRHRRLRPGPPGMERRRIPIAVPHRVRLLLHPGARNDQRQRPSCPHADARSSDSQLCRPRRSDGARLRLRARLCRFDPGARDRREHRSIRCSSAAAAMRSRAMSKRSTPARRSTSSRSIRR